MAVVITKSEFKQTIEEEKNKIGIIFCHVEISKHIIHESKVEKTLTNQ